MKTNEKVRALLKSNGHKVADEVPDGLYEKLLAEIHAGDYKDSMSNMEEQELAQYMAATYGAQTSVKAVVLPSMLRRVNIALGKNASLVDVVWKGAVVVLMFALCLKGC